MVRCISKHTTSKNVGGVVEELTRNKRMNQVIYRNPMKKLGTIYRKKGGVFSEPRIIKVKKSKAERQIENLKNDVFSIRNRFNESKNFLDTIAGTKMSILSNANK